MQSSSDEISIETIPMDQKQKQQVNFKYLPYWPPVNIEFQDLVYSVPDYSGAHKPILRGITGKFTSGQLTAILGPSGAGKSTLLNLLAGFRCPYDNNHITINGKPRDMQVFRRMSRYIMQEDLTQKFLTVIEAMKYSISLKLGHTVEDKLKQDVINDVLKQLRLSGCENTYCHLLSGGQRKRLSIALEMVDNPPVIFLDEPTTGLDDMASSQCISMLKSLADGGRTIVCSIHTPSAKIFEMFNLVYIMVDGQCAYQGHGTSVVPFLEQFNLRCPLTYNPADFVIEVANGDYGDEYAEKMVAATENGKCRDWIPDKSEQNSLRNTKLDDAINANVPLIEQFDEEINPKLLQHHSSWWQQFKILHYRMLQQMYRDKSYVGLQMFMIVFLGLVIGGLYINKGNDGSSGLQNFGFGFTVAIAFMYTPMMLILLHFPFQMKLLKREHFNRWYRLSAYYSAMIIATLPMKIFMVVSYVTIIYVMAGQPMEWKRIVMFYTISFLISINSESYGTFIASRLSLLNGMFVGPVMTVPLMLLSTYGLGYGKETPVSGLMKFIRSLSYLRFGVEGLTNALFGHDRADTDCKEIYCHFRNSKYLLDFLGYGDANFFISMIALIGYYLLFTIGAFYLIKSRLRNTRSNYAAVQYIGQFVKSHFNLSNRK